MVSGARLFPTTFSDELHTLEPDVLDEPGRRALGELATMGFVVEAGLRKIDVPGITEIAGQLPVRTYCWNDIEGRFGTESMAERWLSKARGMMQLRHPSAAVQAAYGWEGPEWCEYLPGCENTFAVRVNKDFGKRGLGMLFSTVLVSGSAALYGARNVGLETWKSNMHAVTLYEKMSAERVTERESMRKTLDGGRTPDTRVYMQFPHTFV
jgi:hypothetical protein